MNKIVVKKSSKRGANFVEYLVLVGVIALAGITIFQAFGSKVGKASEKQGTKVENIPSG